MRQNGILNGNEIRELENRNPTDDGSGTKYWMPANMIEAGQIPEQEEIDIDRGVSTNGQVN